MENLQNPIVELKRKRVDDTQEMQKHVRGLSKKIKTKPLREMDVFNAKKELYYVMLQKI